MAAMHCLLNVVGEDVVCWGPAGGWSRCLSLMPCKQAVTASIPAPRRHAISGLHDSVHAVFPGRGGESLRRVLVVVVRSMERQGRGLRGYRCRTAAARSQRNNRDRFAQRRSGRRARDEDDGETAASWISLRATEREKERSSAQRSVSDTPRLACRGKGGEVRVEGGAFPYCPWKVLAALCDASRSQLPNLRTGHGRPLYNSALPTPLPNISLAHDHLHSLTSTPTTTSPH